MNLQLKQTYQPKFLGWFEKKEGRNSIIVLGTKMSVEMCVLGSGHEDVTVRGVWCRWKGAIEDFIETGVSVLDLRIPRHWCGGLTRGRPAQSLRSPQVKTGC